MPELYEIQNSVLMKFVGRSVLLSW